MQPNWLSVWKSGVVTGREWSIGVGPVHADAALSQHVGKVVEQLVAAVDGVLRALAPLAAHV
jgi:hypothetical protein